MYNKNNQTKKELLEIKQLEPENNNKAMKGLEDKV